MNQLPLFPPNFKTEKIAIKFPPELLMQLPEICGANHMQLFPWRTLKQWLKERIEEDLIVYVYYHKSEDEHYVSCFTEKYWEKEEYLLLELDEFASVSADCPDILDLL